ncbi:roundabout homolog 4 isoform X1 [Pelobates fuscus]|uniref:roundabout homolog 4 isoform X1 n=1 Tax=Pelobates fuscus TaxID=191477 RepID=UPI002FE4AF23
MFFLVFMAVFAALPLGWCSQVNYCQCDQPVKSEGHGTGHSYRQTRHLHHQGSRRRHRVRGSKTLSDEFAPRIIDHPSDLVVQKDKPATLNCRAEGNPAPTIEWYRNGEYVETNKNTQHPQRVLLPGGSLFFYQLKGKSDEGIYMCVARNHLGTAYSRNSSLFIAALRDDFRLQPSNAMVAVGNPLVIDCLPPKGHPEPTVTWKKDGVPVTASSRFTVAPGKLAISYALKSDSGVYMCVATNQAGEKESRGAQISVLEKPVITTKPVDIVTRLGSIVQFSCGVQGDPKPIVQWGKEGGELPQGRYEITGENTLRIKHVIAHDSGNYICTARNIMESVSAQGLLIVRDPLDTGQIDWQKEVHRQLANVRVVLDNITALPTSSVYVHWKVSSPSPLIEGYSVLYRLHKLSDSQWTEWILPVSTEYNAIIPSLRRGQTYDLKIRPFARKIYGTESNTRRIQIPDAVPDVAPQNINVTRGEDGNGSIIVSWDAPPLGIYSDNIKGYKVWCFGNETYPQSDWIVDEETKRLEIPALTSGVQYQVQVAAINDAGIGIPSKPKYIFLADGTEVTREKKEDVLYLDFVLQVLRHPAFIATAGAIAWLILMMVTIYICQRHSRRYSTKKRSDLVNGLYRFASEDTIIKHRMDTSDSPWLSNTWKSTSCSRNYSSTTSMNSQFLWSETKDAADFHKSTISFERKSEGSRSQIISVVPDSSSLYGALYVDLPGRDMTTFQRPLPGKHAVAAPCGRERPVPLEMPGKHDVAAPCGRERPVPLTMFDQRSFSQFCTENHNHIYGDARNKLQRKPTDSPNISLKESWVHNFKKELHQVNSAPLSPSCQTPENGRVPGFKRPEIHQSGNGDYAKVMKTFSSPKILQYTTSLKVVDLLPFTALPPPPVPPPQEDSSRDAQEDIFSNSSSNSGRSQEKDQKRNNIHQKQTPPNTLNFNRASATSLSFSMNGDNVLTPEDVEKYLELGAPEDNSGCNSVIDSTLPQPIRSAHTYGYICSPLSSELVESVQMDEDDDLEMDDVNSLKSYRKYCETPTSSISEYESSIAGSLVNGWGSVSEDNYTSARCSMVSSTDGSFLMDANFAKALAVAVDSFCFGEDGGTDRVYTDYAPFPAPLDGVTPGNTMAENGEMSKKKGKRSALPVLDWNIDWMDEMETKYSAKNHFPFNKKINPFN